MEHNKLIASVRAAGPSDVEFIAGLHLAALRTLNVLAPDGYGSALQEPPPADEVIAEFAGLIDDAAAILLVCETEGELSGFVLGAIEVHGDDLLDAPFITVQYLAVAEKFRKQGIADQLLRELEAEAARRGIGTIDLLVWESNTAARSLYEKRGYATLERRMVKRLQ